MKKMRKVRKVRTEKGLKKHKKEISYSQSELFFMKMFTQKYLRLNRVKSKKKKYYL
jgi:hypothetical protein